MQQAPRNPAVEAVVIRPMKRRYRAPAEVRGDHEAEELALDVYRRALDRFPREVLEQGYQAAVERYRFPNWPDCADILEACERLMPEPEQGPTQEEWVQQAVDLAHAYTEKFMKTRKEAAQAREGGYEPKLKRYVFEAAYLQGQKIAGRTGGTNFDGILVAHLPREQQEDALNELIDKAATQAERGHIRVTVPLEAMRMWQAEAEKGRGR